MGAGAKIFSDAVLLTQFLLTCYSLEQILVSKRKPHLWAFFEILTHFSTLKKLSVFPVNMGNLLFSYSFYSLFFNLFMASNFVLLSIYKGLEKCE
jgi:hypothetical protein